MYTFTLTVTNWLSESASSDHTVEVEAGDFPAVEINGLNVVKDVDITTTIPFLLNIDLGCVRYDEDGNEITTNIHI